MKYNLKKKTNWTSISVSIFLVFIIITMAFVSKQSMEAVRQSVEAKIEVDSVNYKIDSRYKSYDAVFIQTNSIVIDSTGKYLGKVVVETTKEKIENYYEDSLREKTKTYHNLKNGTLNVVNKK